MNAVMYGGGNIGRGFIGGLLSQSGYRVTFIDVAEPVVKHLQEKGCYPVRYVSSEGYEDVLITANIQYRNIHIFPSGIVLSVPQVDTRKVSGTSVPWRRKT